MKLLKSASLVFAGCLFAASASATVYTYNSNNAGIFSNSNVNPNGYGYDSISASYDDSNDQFSWNVDYNSLGNAEGFWLVVSDGPNPKSNVNEYTMFYGDHTSGNLSAYVYNGQNGPGSWVNNPFIGDYSSGLTATGFSIDATAMNSVPFFGQDWDGAQFADNIGIWFHPVFDLNASFNNDGSISQFSPSSAFWYDTHMDGDCGTNDRGCVTATASVPEPTSMALMGLGLLGLGAARKKKLVK